MFGQWLGQQPLFQELDKDRSVFTLVRFFLTSYALIFTVCDQKQWFFKRWIQKESTEGKHKHRKGKESKTWINISNTFTENFNKL